MIQTYSTTIRRKEMDAVLTCMVDEKIGPGELNSKLIQLVKEFTKCDGAAALRSPAIALKYALRALDLQSGSKVIISALAPAWQYQTLTGLGFEPLVVDVDETTGLASVEKIKLAVENGGKVLLFHETEGILPDFEALAELGIPLIEDISHSAGSSVPVKDENGNLTEKRNPAGSFGVFTIMGLEEHDVITAGGGAILYASGRREWIVLKKYLDEAPLTDLLPDINCALAWVQIKEFGRNEKTRKELFALYQKACMLGHHKLYAREMEEGSTMCSFPLVLAGSYKDVKMYTSKKDVEIEMAYNDSVIHLLLDREDDSADPYTHAKSLYLRCVHIPLYPRLTHAESAKIVKVLSSLP